MTRNSNTKVDGSQFSLDTIDAVWEKAKVLAPVTGFAKDGCGAVIQRSKHGLTEKWGWEIDHIKPVSMGGTDDLSNLQPLHWENNRHKGDDWPEWKCTVRS